MSHVSHVSHADMCVLYPIALKTSLIQKETKDIVKDINKKVTKIADKMEVVVEAPRDYTKEIEGLAQKLHSAKMCILDQRDDLVKLADHTEEIADQVIKTAPQLATATPHDCMCTSGEGGMER